MHIFYITDVKEELSKDDSTNIKTSNHIIQLYDTLFSLSNLTRNEFDI